MSKEEKSAKVKKSLNKKRDDKKEAARAKFKREHFNRQARSTKQRMLYNERKSEEWREENFGSQKPPFFKRISLWFKNLFSIFKKREKGLFDDDDIIK